MTFDLERSFDERELRTRLAETKAWCTAHAVFDEPKTSLRNFSPDYELLMDRDDQVASIASKRKKQLELEGFDLVSLSESEIQGRFLLYFPDIDLYDGAAEGETDGFFDAHNRPPEDTWLGMVGAKAIFHS